MFNSNLLYGREGQSSEATWTEASAENGGSTERDFMIPVPINQKRVAELAGVSQSTVSLILSGKEVGSQATRRKVLQTAERLGYRPNLLVHGIQTGKTRMIGVMAPPFDYYWTEVLYGIHDALIGADHVPINIWATHHGTISRHSELPQNDVLRQIHRLLDRRVDGVILWPPLASLFQEHIKEFSSRNLPVVTIDHDLPKAFKADSVGSDELMGGQLVARHLLDLGHRTIGHLAGPTDASWALRRRMAFEGAMADQKQVKCVTIEADLKRVDQGIAQARQMLDMTDRPTAIFAATDPLAASVYRAAEERGLKIPRDLSIVGFADDDFTSHMNPPLTTVRQSAYEIGQKAAELVMARSSSSNLSNIIQRVNLPVKLVVRESTAEYRAHRH